MKKLFNLHTLFSNQKENESNKTYTMVEIKEPIEEETDVKIQLSKLDEYIDALFPLTEVNLIMPKFNLSDKYKKSNLRDYTIDGNDPLGSLIELKIRLLKNVLNIFDPGYNYDDVIDSILDGSYPTKLIIGFNHHLSIYHVTDDQIDNPPVVVNRNDRIHVRGIMNRALTDINTLYKDMSTIEEFSYSYSFKNYGYNDTHYNLLTTECLSIVSLYIGIFANSKYLTINKKFKRLVRYFIDSSTTVVNSFFSKRSNLFAFNRCVFDTKSLNIYISHLSNYSNIVYSFVLIRKYQDNDWQPDYLVLSDLVELLSPPDSNDNYQPKE